MISFVAGWLGSWITKTFLKFKIGRN